MPSGVASASRGGASADRVPLAPLRNAFRASGLSMREVQRRAGRSEGWARRYLIEGAYYYEYRSGLRERVYTEHCEYATAVRIAEALGIDPVEVGL
jgi:hypothetical protein